MQWTYDTHGLAVALARSVVDEGFKRWFFLTADYAFGQSLAAEAGAVVKARGGEVVGEVRHPLGTADFASFLLQAQASNADAIGLANATTDTTNAIKQAREFGLTDARRRLVALLMLVSDVEGLGLEAAQGLVLSESYYWDRDEASRRFGERFFARMNRMPTMMQAGVYSSVQHYLKAVQAAGTDEAGAVMAKMRELPVANDVTRAGRVRADGRMVADLLVLQVKTPAESRSKWDLLKMLRAVPGDEAYRSLEESECPLVKKG